MLNNVLPTLSLNLVSVFMDGSGFKRRLSSSRLLPLRAKLAVCQALIRSLDQTYLETVIKSAHFHSFRRLPRSIQSC